MKIIVDEYGDYDDIQFTNENCDLANFVDIIVDNKVTCTINIRDLMVVAAAFKQANEELKDLNDK